MERTCVRDVMSSPAIVVSPDLPIPAASALMKRHHIRHLPVVENGQLVGLVSMGDLREATHSAAINADSYELNFALSRLPISKVMTRKVYTVTADALVVHAAELMTEHKIAGLPVVDKDGTVLGIVTEMDLLHLLVRKVHETEDNFSTAGSNHRQQGTGTA